jgi:hypothetical protein
VKNRALAGSLALFAALASSPAPPAGDPDPFVTLYAPPRITLGGSGDPGRRSPGGRQRRRRVRAARTRGGRRGPP